MDESQQSSKEILTGQRANEKVEELIKVLEKSENSAISNGMAHRTKMVDIENYIDYTEVFQIKQTNGITNYTYRVSMPDATDKSFYNIVMKTYNGVYKTILIKYNMDATFAKDYFEGKAGFENFTGTMEFEIIDIDPGFPCDDDVEGSTPVSGGGGGGGSNGGGAGNPVDLSGGAANGGPTHGGSTYSQAIVDAKFLALQIMVVEEQWLEVSRSPRYFRMPQTTVEPGNPCGDGEEIGILTPLDIDNCNDLKAKSQNANFQNLMTQLKAKAGTQNFESAYAMYNTANGTTTPTLNFSNEMTGTPQSKEVSLIVNQSSTQVPLNSVGFIHCHTDDGTTFKVFSFSDMIALGTIAKVSTRPSSELAVYVTTASGTFALKINNKTALVNKLMQMELLSDSFEVAYSKYVKKTDSIDQQTLGLLNFIQKEFGTAGVGIDLYQQESNGQWSKLTVSSTGTTINKKTC
jgi:hypothetical protein